MKINSQIACITGGSGIIGKRIIERLKNTDLHIRALSRRKQSVYTGVEYVKGDLNDMKTLNAFLSGANLLFHCAGEVNDESQMDEVNVQGTKILFNSAKASNIKYFCYISSAGVVGKTDRKWVDESVDCQPQNAYERSKFLAEQVVREGIDGCRVVILRPTNVVDKDQPGALKIVTDCSTISRFKLLLVGGEGSHIIHADNVAAAAIHFIDKPIAFPECFFVSSDHESATSFSELFALYQQLSRQASNEKIRQPVHLPIFIPYVLRKIFRGHGNMGDVRYSSEKLHSTGFKFPLSIEDTLRQFMNSANLKQCES